MSAPIRGVALAVAAAGGLALLPARGRAQAFSPESFRGFAEFGLGAVDGAPPWISGGPGKLSVGSRRAVSQAVLEWRPQLGFGASATVSVQFQPAVRAVPDLDEAYLRFHGDPRPQGEAYGRIGLFYPPGSLENAGPGWTTVDTLSASALDTWLGEEGKVAGLEIGYRRTGAAGRLDLSGALFGGGDTAGALLAFRGWSLGELRGSSRYDLPLPPHPMGAGAPVEETYPLRELDGRAGWYGRVAWTSPTPFRVTALYVDNNGARRAHRNGQWSWDTRYLDLGAEWRPSGSLQVEAQALAGVTRSGLSRPPVALDVRAAYGLASWRLGGDVLTGRVDLFETRDRAPESGVGLGERGWAATAAWRRPVSPRLDLLVELQHASSLREARLLAGEAPRQAETRLTAAVRVGLRPLG